MTATEIAERQTTDALDIPDILKRDAAPLLPQPTTGIAEVEGPIVQEPSTVPQLLQPAPAITPMQMLQIAVEKNADLDQLQKLMDLQERWEANEARKAYVVALTAFKRTPPTVVKNKQVGYDSKKAGAGRTQYDYATLAQVADAISPALAEHGLSYSWSTSQSENGIAVTCALTHQMGHGETVTMSAPADNSGSKNVIQALGSTVTYLERYTLLAITGLATIDQDDDGDGVVTLISPEQKNDLIVLMKEVNADAEKFLDWLGVEYIDNLPSDKFDRAIKALEKKKAHAGDAP